MALKPLNSDYFLCKFVKSSKTYKYIYIFFCLTPNYYFQIPLVNPQLVDWNNYAVSALYNAKWIKSLTNIQFLFSFFFKLFFVKLKFTGKGYKFAISSRKTLTFNFGFSHRYYFYNFQTIPLRLTKTKFLLFGLNFFHLRLKAFEFYFIKPLNIYTLRGVRFSRQIVFKKIGKLSLYF